jgi:hypothetical protein
MDPLFVSYIRRSFLIPLCFAATVHSQAQQALPYSWTNFAGNPGVTGTANGIGATAQFYQPGGVTVDGSGNLYVADTENQTIREITPGGVVTTLAGTPRVTGTSDGTGSAAQFSYPEAIAVDRSGNLYVADTENQTIREIAPGGVVTTLAGTPGVTGTSDGTGSAAQFYYPAGVAVDGSGNVYVADTNNQTIREIAPGGVVTTLAGTPGATGTSDGTGSAAQFNYPFGITVDGSGNLYVADYCNDTIREIAPGGVVTTLAGTPGVIGTADGTGSAAQFNYPMGVTVDGSGNLYVADTINNTIREIATGGVVTTIGGSAGARGTQAGVGPVAQFNNPYSVAITGSGLLYVADFSNSRIALGTYSPFTVPPVLTSPAVNSTFLTSLYFAPVSVNFTLPEQALPGSVTLTFDDGGGTLRVLTLSSSEEGPGTPNTFTFDPGDPVGSSNGAVASLSGDSLIPPGVYTVTLSYQDAAADPAATAVATNVTLTPVMTNFANGGYFSVNSFSATLSGMVGSDYLSSASNIYIESGTDTTYGNPHATANIQWWDWYWYGVWGANVPGLTRDTTYHYQLVATINGTTYYGGDQTFVTTHDDSCYVPTQTFYEPVKSATPITLDVLAGATATNPSDVLRVLSFSHPAGGKLAFTTGSAALLYTPSSRYSGHDSFTYTIGTGFGETFTATAYIINPYVDYAGNYQSLVPGNSGVPGYLTLTLGQQGSFTGSLKTFGGTYSFKGSLNASGTTALTLSSGKLPPLTLDLSLNFNTENNGSSAGSSNGFTCSLTGAGGFSATGYFTPKVLYSSSNPAPEIGTYTILIAPPTQTGTSQASATATVTGGKITVSMSSWGSGYISAPTVTITSAKGKGAVGVPVVGSYGNSYYGSVTGINITKQGSGYTNPLTVVVAPPSGLPQGTGWATMKVANTGAVTLSGKLGDGTAFTAGSWVDNSYASNWYYSGYTYFDAQTFPVFANVYSSPAGYIDGTMTFEDNVGVSDFDGSLSWHKPAQSTAQIYSEGFDISTTMLGSAYVAPTNDFLLDLENGNALITLTGGNLATQLQNSITIPATPVTSAVLVSGSSDSLTMSSTPSTGAFSGKFTPPGATAATSFSGVYFQKQNLGLGVFTGANQSGNVNITPQTPAGTDLFPTHLSPSTGFHRKP